MSLIDNWSRFFESFEPGGETPFDSILGIISGKSNGDIVELNDVVHGLLNMGSPISSNLSLAPNSADTVQDDSSFNDYFQQLMDMQNEINLSGQSSADRAMEFSKEEAQLNRDFQERMSNTAYQRAVEDLKAAGLNPKLVGSLGPASTPSGNYASGVSYAPNSAALLAISGIAQSYINNAGALDRNQNDFVRGILSSLMYVVAYA